MKRRTPNYRQLLSGLGPLFLLLMILGVAAQPKRVLIVTSSFPPPVMPPSQPKYNWRDLRGERARVETWVVEQSAKLDRIRKHQP